MKEKWHGWVAENITNRLLKPAIPMAVAISAFTQAWAHPLDNWSVVHSETNTTLLCVTYGKGLFVAAGADQSGSLILKSEDGMTWTPVGQSLTDIVWQGVAYGQDAFVVVGNQGAIMVSTNAVSWTQVRSEFEENLSAVVVGGGLFITGGYGFGDQGQQAVFVTSADGLTWSPHSLDPNSAYDSVAALAYGNGAFFAATSYSIWRSTDAFDWTSSSLQYSAPLHAVACGPDLAVAVGGWQSAMFRPPTSLVLKSVTGAEWSKDAEWDGSPLTGVAYGDGFYVAVDGSGGIFVSETESCWKATLFMAPQSLFGIAFGNHSFVGVGNEGTIVVSGSIDTNAVRVSLRSCTPYEAREQNGTIRIPVWRTGDLGSSATVYLRSVDSSAIGGDDYVAVQGSLTFAPGETNKEISVQILDDDRPEETESFTLLLQPTAGNTVTGPTDTAKIQILDDDSAHLNHWVDTAALIFANDLTGVAWNGSYFVAIGIKQASDGTYQDLIFRSTDGHQWQNVSPGIPGILRAISSGDGTFVAVGEKPDLATGFWVGQILSSRDGVSWQEFPSGPREDLQTVCYANGRFIAAGATILTSIDGFAWSKPPLPVGLGPIHSVAGGNETFLAAGGNFSFGSWTNYFLVSQDGTNWTIHPSDFPVVLPQLTFGNGLFLIAGVGAESAALIRTSPDGLVWTQRLVKTNLSSAYGNFCAGFAAGNFILTGPELTNDAVRTVALSSPDGYNWTETTPTWRSPTALTYGGGLYLIAGSGIWSSPDFTSWTIQVPDNMDLLDIAYGRDRFVAVGPTILNSADGRSWTSLPDYPQSALRGVTWGNGTFVAVGQDGTVMTSGDGLNWTNSGARLDASLSCVAYGNGRFLALGGTSGSSWWWTNRAFVSPDGFHWNQAFSGTTNATPWLDVTWGNGVFVALAYDSIWTSEDGVSWTAQDRYFYGLQAVTFGAGRFVAVGGAWSNAKYTTSSAVIYYSPDGRNWTNSPLPDPWQHSGSGFFSGVPLSGVVYDGNSFIAVGTGSYHVGDAIISSPDGITRALRWVTDGPGLNSIAAGKGRLLVVGQNGRILRPGVAMDINSALAATHPKFTLSLGSEIGLHHTIQVSTNLLDWDVLKTFTNSTFKTVIPDPQAEVHPVRFYRSRED
jgi:hypothetical protein